MRRVEAAGPGGQAGWDEPEGLPSQTAADAFADARARGFAQRFPGAGPEAPALIAATARAVLDLQARSDALYHTGEHTMLVTLVGERMLEGRRLAGALAAGDWLHGVLGLLVHDVGYARGACAGDTGTRVRTAQGWFTPPEGASDASLAPHHVERGMIHARERFAGHPGVDAERIARAVAHTRFPVPADAPAEAEGVMIRGADLVGQLGDPRYLAKVTALWTEMAETGQADALGHAGPLDLVTGLPDFYAREVAAHVRPVHRLLEATRGGRRWLASLAANLAEAQNAERLAGPYPGAG